jgi:cytosine/adenosine deaminase-related metal-dependent hydrolase
MATRKAPVDPATSPKLTLAGRIVCMDDAFTVIDDGRLYMENGSLVAVLPAAAPPPPGFENQRVIETGSTLFPGLIDLHNHLPYNVLPLWQIPKKFSNRGQWARHAQYRSFVSAPMQVLAATDTLLAAICRYVEAKCLIGGTTTSQGITLANEAGIRRYFQGVVRNVEATNEDALPQVSTRVPDVAARDAAAFFTRLKRETTCYLLHLSEGLDATARRAFAALQFAPGQWAITPSLCGIHAAALTAQDYAVLAEKGGSMVWSPFSNLLLYGDTAKIKDAKAAGVPIALGPDWAPTGSRNLLHELKVAQLYSAQHNVFSARELVAMVTRDAAGLLEWQAVTGSLQAGKRADLIAIAGTAGDPYNQLIAAHESDLLLSVINGVPRFGASTLMRAAGFAGEAIQIGGAARMLYLQHPSADPLVQGMTLAAARDELTSALRRLPTVAKRAEKPVRMSAASRAASAGSRWHLALDELLDTGVDLRVEVAPRSRTGRPLQRALMRPLAAAAVPKLSASVAPMRIDPLTVVDDSTFLDQIDAQPNLPDFIKTGLRNML